MQWGATMGGNYDLEDRTFEFARRVFTFVRSLPGNVVNQEVRSQLIRSSGSVGANYIEANESLGRKDFLMKIRTCLREAKESRYWLRLLACSENLEPEREALIDESTQLLKIFSSIVEKSGTRV